MFRLEKPAPHRSERTLAFMRGSWGPVVFVCCLCLYATSSFASSLQQILAHAQCRSGSVGVSITCLDNDSTLASLNADSQYIPASAAKLIVGAAAAEQWGIPATFKTKVYVAQNSLKGAGIVDGDVLIRGDGDPGILAERIWLLARNLRMRGIQTINGNLILDESLFDTSYEAPGYEADNSSRAYEAPVGALSASWNTIMISCLPGDSIGAPITITCLPESEDLVISSTAKTGASSAKSTLQIRTEEFKGTTRIIVSGVLPLRSTPKSSYQKIWDKPGKNFGKTLKAQLQPNGITLRGTVRFGTVDLARRDTLPFMVFESQQVGEFLKYMFKFSSNYTADMLYKRLGATKKVQGATWTDAAEAIATWWRQSKLPGTITLINGSGMGDKNRVSASQFNALLRHVWHQKTYFPDYCCALATAGIDGTVRSRFKNSRLKGLLRAKTGTLNSNGVSTLAGYAFLGKRTYAFTILINNPSLSQYQQWTIQEQILESILP